MDSPADQPHPTVADPAVPVGFRFVSLIADDGREPPAATTDAEATGAWAAASVPWHPALLAIAADLPRFEDVALPTDPEPGEVRLVAAGQFSRLPANYRDLAHAAGVPILEVQADRRATVGAILAELQAQDPAFVPPSRPLDDPLAADYLAMGACHWWIRDLTIAMEHVDTLARSSLLREALGGGKAWVEGDQTAAENHLRAGFELLAQARERFYPMDGFLVDFVLLDPSSRADAIEPLLDSNRPFTLIAPAQAIDRFATARPDLAARLRAAIEGGWADVVGGAWTEADEPFLPWSSLAWQFGQGSVGYRQHLDDRNVETLARRRYGLYPQLPQVARRFGLRYAYLVALDEGRFPLVPEAKRQWASPDGTTLESITRPPIAADRPAEAVRLAWRMAQSMKDDGTATLPLAHWPEPVAPWFADLRRSGKYANILGRWVTANDFFHYSDRPFEEITLGVDDLANAYLAQAVVRGDLDPIRTRATHTQLRAGLDALAATLALVAVLAGQPVEPLDPAFEFRAETTPTDAQIGEASSQLEAQVATLARSIVGANPDQVGSGFLVCNPTGIPRRALVEFAAGVPIANAGAALKACQPAGTGAVGTVELAPFGFAWFAAQPQDQQLKHPAGSVTVRGQTISQESLSVAVDPATGGIRGVTGIGEESARLGQQLVIQGLVGPDGKPATSRMRASKVEVKSTGPALGTITSEGTLHDPGDDRVLARFTQTVSLVSGRPDLRLEIQLRDFDPRWLAGIATADPWNHYLACRWAWPDAQSTLRRSALLALFPTTAERPETPDALDITSRQRRTTLLFGGLPHHRRHGARMLDTLLVAGRSRPTASFALGVTLNLEHAFPSVIDFHGPCPVVATGGMPPASGPVGWLLRVDHKSVALLRLTFAPRTNHDQGWGVIADLIETAGKPARCRLKSCRDPIHARQVTGHGEHVVDLSVDGDEVSIDLTPHEIARVELTFGLLEAPNEE